MRLHNLLPALLALTACSEATLEEDVDDGQGAATLGGSLLSSVAPGNYVGAKPGDALLVKSNLTVLTIAVKVNGSDYFTGTADVSADGTLRFESPDDGTSLHLVREDGRTIRLTGKFRRTNRSEAPLVTVDARFVDKPSAYVGTTYGGVAPGSPTFAVTASDARGITVSTSWGGKPRFSGKLKWEHAAGTEEFEIVSGCRANIFFYGDPDGELQGSVDYPGGWTSACDRAHAGN